MNEWMKEYLYGVKITADAPKFEVMIGSGTGVFKN